MPRTLRTFSSKIATFSQFQVCLSKTNDKSITFQSFLSIVTIRTDEFKQRKVESNEYIVYGLVTRYGPQSVAQRKRILLSPSLEYFSVRTIQTHTHADVVKYHSQRRIRIRYLRKQARDSHKSAMKNTTYSAGVQN